MSLKANQKLLKNRKVVEEIGRHQWIESERAGYDIGFEEASTQWLEKFSTAWMQYHMPKQKKPSLRSGFTKKSSPQKTSSQRSSQVKSKAKRS